METEKTYLERKVDSYDDYLVEKKDEALFDDKFIEAYSVIACNSFEEKGVSLEYAKKTAKKAKKVIDDSLRVRKGYGWFDLEKYCKRTQQDSDMLDFYYDVLRFEAQYGNFESYLIYLEKSRTLTERFYLPKRKQLLKTGCIQGLQDLTDDVLDLLSLSMPPGTGKTTLNKFYMSFLMGLFPEEFNLFYSHSADICRMYYDGVLQILTDTQEYKWGEIFTGMQVTRTNAKAMKINIGKIKSFDSLQCGSRGSELAGKVRASKLLSVDDLIGKQEEALNNNTLDKIWNNDYTTDALQRKTVDNEGNPAKELHIATRWSVRDVIGRLQSANEGNPRARFIAVPDIDPITGKSNFDFEVKGFSVAFFNQQEKLMDDITYKCLYKNEPIEREGLLYHDSDLRRFFELPNREADAIIGVCDTKSKGIDYMVLPVLYVYGDDYYLFDCVCNNSSDYNLQEERLTNIICEHEMQRAEFESNAGGDRLAANVAAKVKERGGRCSITTKPTETNKETRIIVNSNWVKEHILFKDSSLYTRKSEYGEFMNQLLSYSVSGKNVHDDVPDALANFALFATKPERRVARIMQGIL